VPFTLLLTILTCGCSDPHSSIRFALLDSDSVVIGQVEHINVLKENRANDWLDDSNSRLRDAVWITGEARLLVQDRIWGAYTAGDELSIQWTRAIGVGVKRSSELEEPADVDYASLQGVPRIWLLSKKTDGQLTVERILQVSAKSLVQTLLEENPFRVRDKGLYRIGQPVTFVLQFRNAGQRAIEIPAIELRPDGLFHSPGISLELRAFPDDRRRSGRIHQDTTLHRRPLAPGATAEALIDLNKVYDFKECDGGMMWIEADGVREPVLEVIAIAGPTGNIQDCWDEEQRRDKQ
jgi:hypothetical protein